MFSEQLKASSACQWCLAVIWKWSLLRGNALAFVRVLVLRSVCHQARFVRKMRVFYVENIDSRSSMGVAGKPFPSPTTFLLLFIVFAYLCFRLTIVCVYRKHLLLFPLYYRRHAKEVWRGDIDALFLASEKNDKNCELYTRMCVRTFPRHFPSKACQSLTPVAKRKKQIWYRTCM